MKPETQMRLLSQAISSWTGCWLWTGHIKPDGYPGNATVGSERMSAHRASYVLFVGPIPDGLELDHLCRVRSCVNPAHLEPVTHAENVRRANAARTHCVNGHVYDDKNTYIRPNGYRDCRPCVAVRQRKYRARRNGA